MPLALASPTTIGLYINSVRISSSSTDPYTDLLGTDGYGTYSGGNKLDELFSYMAFMGYNYGITYGTSGTAFVGSDSANETFTATGNDYLKELIYKAKVNFGITEMAAVCDLFKVNTSLPIANRDGLHQIRKILDYNSDHSFNANYLIDWINIETEFWNFPESAFTVTLNGRVNVSGNTVSWTGSGTTTNFITAGVRANHFIKIAGQYRQVIDVTSNTTLRIDRALSSSVSNQSVLWATSSSGSNTNNTVDYNTFLYRIAGAEALIDAGAGTELLEIYVGFPDYTNYGSGQLAAIDAHLDRMLLHNYAYKPSWSRMDGGTIDRVTGDLVTDTSKVHEIGAIISMESFTFNNSSCSDNSANNFSGYLAEGRTQYPTLNGSITYTGSCTCSTPCSSLGVFTVPAITDPPKSLQDFWDYLTPDPVVVLSPAVSSPTYNQAINAGGTDGTNLDNYTQFRTLVVFDQELVRQLTTDPPDPIVISGSVTDIPCSGDGSVNITVSGGTAPYTYLWDDAGATTTQDLPGITIPDTYTVVVTDAVAATATAAFTVGEVVDNIDITLTATVTGCEPNAGFLTITGITGGTPPYTYQVDAGAVVALSTVPVTVGSLSINTSHSVTILDANGCTRIESITPTRTLATFSSSSVATTCGLNNGTVTINILTGTAPFVVSCSTKPDVTTSATTIVFTGLAAATYDLEIVDANGCSATGTRAVNTGAATFTLGSVVENISCYGEATNSVNLTVTGGTGPFTYVWSNGANTQDLANVRSGNYSVTVTDANGCVVTHNAIVTGAHTAPIEITSTVTDVSEDGLTLGSISIDSVSGADPVGYVWSHGPTTSSVTGLEEGTYTVTITDTDDDCGQVFSFTIERECANYTRTEFETILFNAQCCRGQLTEVLRKRLILGNTDEIKCTFRKLKLLDIIIRRLSALENPMNSDCLGCDGVYDLLLKIKEICDCDCCGDESIVVEYDNTTNSINPAE
jgi:hypothetical protein